MSDHEKQWKSEQLQKYKVIHLYHLTSISNLNTILTNGILPMDRLQNSKIEHEDISIQTAMSRRAALELTTSKKNTRKSYSMVPLFFRTKTPMSYTKKNQSDNLCIIAVSKKIMTNDSLEIVITDGNLASPKTSQYPGFGTREDETLNKLDWDCIRSKFWTDHINGSIKCAAEVMVYPYVAPSYIQSVFVKSDKAKEKARSELDKCASSIECLKLNQHFF